MRRVWGSVGLVLALMLGTVGLAAAPAQAAIACKDVFFLGARGSGEPQTQAEVKKNSGQVAGYGATVDKVRAQVVTAAATKGLSIETQYLYYPAESTVVLKKFDWGYPTGIKTYFAGLETGVGVAITTLDLRAQACPNERLVLAGYSQGAMVMHRLVNRLDSSYLSRISALVLIADGDQVSPTRAERRGTAPVGNTGIAEYGRKFGLLSPPYVATGSDVPLALSGRALAVCNDGDLICDFSAGLVKNSGSRNKAIAVHTAYSSSSLPGDAGAWAGQQLVATNVEGVALTWVSPPAWQWVTDIDGGGPNGSGYVATSTAHLVTSFPLDQLGHVAVFAFGTDPATGNSRGAFYSSQLLSGTVTDGTWLYTTAFPDPSLPSAGTYTVNQVCLSTDTAYTCRAARPSEVVTFTIPPVG